jgi:hypothetical protein
MQEYRLVLSQAAESDPYYISRTSQMRLRMSDNAATLDPLRLQPAVHEIEVKEKAREAKLDYDESESLLRYLNFQRERWGEPPINADYGQLCDHLSEIYPDVEFNLAD